MRFFFFPSIAKHVPIFVPYIFFNFNFSKIMRKIIRHIKNVKQNHWGIIPLYTPENELFLGIFRTTPIIDIRMILFGLDESIHKVYEKKIFFYFI